MANSSLSGGGGGTGKEGDLKEDQIQEARRPVSLKVPAVRNKSPENGGIGRRKGERRGPSEHRSWSFCGGPMAEFLVVDECSNNEQCQIGSVNEIWKRDRWKKNIRI
ncbi:hypothetical protein ACOSP7_026625 [Xanthoceras sorbifolium]